MEGRKGAGVGEIVNDSRLGGRFGEPQATRRGAPARNDRADAERQRDDDARALRPRECAPVGFGLVEAENLEEAVALVAKTPCAVAGGAVEVWPTRQP